jgi:uncharacterized protein YqjF (DUF2071 family)
MIDRLAIRERPPGRPLMHQRWGSLLFLHWPVPAALLRPLVDPRLEIDTYDDVAWVGVTPFTMWGIRPSFLPPLPGLSRSHELNVRTYVHHEGVPGVWFLSLDASNAAAVWGARHSFHLPYYRARMRLRSEGDTIHFGSRRTHAGALAAVFGAEWTIAGTVTEAMPGTLDDFLVERYCLYAADETRLLRSRIHHRPWPLRAATLAALTSTMLEAHGLPTPTRAPLLHALAEPLHVEVWPPRRVG